VGGGLIPPVGKKNPGFRKPDENLINALRRNSIDESIPWIIIELVGHLKYPQTL